MLQKFDPNFVKVPNYTLNCEIFSKPREERRSFTRGSPLSLTTYATNCNNKKKKQKTTNNKEALYSL